MIDGPSLYRGYFVPNGVDPLGLVCQDDCCTDDCCTEEYKKKIDNAFARFKSCPLAKGLWDGVEKTLGKIKIRCDKDSEFGAAWEPGDDPTISIGCYKDEAWIIAAILFETLNASNDRTLATLNRLGRLGLLGRDQYARAIVKTEYSHLRKHHSIASACFLFSYWPEAADGYKDQVELGLTPDQFADSWEESQHYDSYTEDWDKYFKKPWCQKNAGHPDCQ